MKNFLHKRGECFYFEMSHLVFSFFFPLTHGRNQKTMEKKLLMFYIGHLTLRSISSLNNRKNSKMKICENMMLIC